MAQGQTFLKWGGGGGRGGGGTLQNCVMHLKKNYFFLPPWFYEKGHSKLSKIEPENIPYIKITYL